MRRVILGLLFMATVFGCQFFTTDTDDETAAGELSECCTKALALREGIPDCCIEGMATGTGCCATGMAETTLEAERPACCKTALAALAQMSPCCREAMQGGEVADCCTAMMAAIDGS